MSAPDRQLRLVRPTRVVSARGLTSRQQILLGTLRDAERPMALSEIDARWTTQFSGREKPDRIYQQLSAALGRLVDRKLVVRVKRGTYQAVTVRERKA